MEPIFTDALREIYLGEAVGKSKEWARRNVTCSVGEKKPLTGPRTLKIDHLQAQNLKQRYGTVFMIFTAGLWKVQMIISFLYPINVICPAKQAAYHSYAKTLIKTV